MRPLLKHALPGNALAIYQPMYGTNLVSERSPLYDEQYVRDRSIQPLLGTGSVFVGTSDGGARLLGPSETCTLVPTINHPDWRLPIQSAIEVCGWQNWLNDGTVNLDRLLPAQKRLVRTQQGIAKRWNDTLTKYHTELLLEKANSESI